MSAVLPVFRILAPEFDGKDDDDVEALIDFAATWIDAPVFGIRTSEAIARLVAHECTLQLRNAEGSGAGGGGAVGIGSVTSRKAGDLAVGFGGFGGFSSSSNAQDDYFRQTQHGLAFLSIRDSRAETGFGLIT